MCISRAKLFINRTEQIDKLVKYTFEGVIIEY